MPLGDRLTRAGVVGCGLSLIGSLFVTLDLSAMHLGAEGLTSGIALGDGITLMAALFYSFSNIRLGTFAKDFNPTELSAGNVQVSIFCAALWLLLDLSRL